MHGEGRLAYAAHADHGHYWQRVPYGGSEGCPDFFGLGRAADEVGRRGRQLCRPRRVGHGRPGRRGRTGLSGGRHDSRSPGGRWEEFPGLGRLTVQDLSVQLGQLRSRLDTELLHQHLAHPAEGRQRVRLPTAVVQRPHQQPVRSLAQRVLGGQRDQLRHAVGGPAEHQIERQPLF